jgi:hypothetical protein
MPTTFNWQNAIHDPRFWAMRYEGLPGISWEEIHSYIEESDFLNLAILEDDPLAGYAGEDDDLQLAEVEVGDRCLALPFPEGYIWLMDFATEDSPCLAGIYHTISHPTIDPVGFLHTNSTGLSLAEESGHQRLPGLRWTELKYIQNCLAQNWSGDFDVWAIVPLLYPVVQFITFDELEDVRYTLTAAWQNLGALNAKQVDSWLDDLIIVYDKGRILRLDDQKEWKPLPGERVYEGELWIQTGKDEWKTFHSSSERYFKKDSSQFLPFFSMLERYD